MFCQVQKQATEQQCSNSEKPLQQAVAQDGLVQEFQFPRHITSPGVK
jgi:hypothetical protein